MILGPWLCRTRQVRTSLTCYQSSKSRPDNLRDIRGVRIRSVFSLVSFCSLDVILNLGSARIAIRPWSSTWISSTQPHKSVLDSVRMTSQSHPWRGSNSSIQRCLLQMIMSKAICLTVMEKLHLWRRNEHIHSEEKAESY